MHRCDLNLGNIMVLVILLTPLQPLQAQYNCGDECKINSNLAAVINVPVNSTAQVVGTGWGTVVGVGYNFNRSQAVIGEFLWNRVYSSDMALQPLKAAVQPSNLSGIADLYSITGNYRFELRGRLFGTYLIGGGGWYYRDTNLSKAVTASPGTICTTAWLWWGFTCVSGTVTAGQTVSSSGSSAWGGERGHGTHCKSRRSTLPALQRSALSLCSNQEHQHRVHNGCFRNPLLRKLSIAVMV